MADHVPRQSGGFLKGFVMGTIVSLIAGAIGLLTFPEPESFRPAETATPAVSSEMDPNFERAETPDAPEVGGVTITADVAVTDTLGALPDLTPSQSEPTDAALAGDQSSAPVPNVIQQAERLDAVPVPEFERAPTQAMALAPVTLEAVSSSAAEPRIPQTEGLAAIVPVLPDRQDQAVEVVTDEPVPADASTEALDASLPEPDSGIEDAATAAKPETTAPMAEDAANIDTQSARVRRPGDAPEQPAAQSLSLGLVTQLAAPSPPRLPRASLTAPQSAFPDPVPLTLPNTAAPVEKDLPDVYAARTERKDAPGSLTKNGEPTAAEPKAPVIEEDNSNGGAFDRYAAEFEASGDGPFVAVVLQDIGVEEGISREELASIGTWVTFAIDPDSADAQSAQTQFRDAGFEVVALIPSRGDRHIGQGTSPGRVGAIADDVFSNVPGAVALMDAPNGDLFRNNRVVLGLASHLRESGHGFLIHERFGVNRAIDTLQNVDIPAAPVLRIIDNQRDQEAIRRHLDRAAIDAKKTGSIVVFGRTYPETISALGIWSLSRAGRAVVFAPLTAALKRSQ